MRLRRSSVKFGVEGRPGLWAAAADDSRFVHVSAVTDDGWLISWSLVEQEGRPVLRDLAVEPARDVPPGGLAINRLRDLRQQELIEIALKKLRADNDPEWTGSFVAFLKRKPLERKPGRNRRADVDYAEIAARYVELVKLGDPAPVKRIARERGESVYYVRDMLREARRRGLLTPPAGGSGTVGGVLTDKAEALLAEAKKTPPRRGRGRGHDTTEVHRDARER